MTSIRQLVATTLIGSALTVAPLIAHAAPTETTRTGATAVTLAPAFLGALQSLAVTPAAIAPSKLVANAKGVRAWFVISTGAVDLATATPGGTLKAEISHEGGLSLSKGNTRVELSSFAIEIDAMGSLLTGLAVVNDSLAGRIPLFDLDLSKAGLGLNGNILRVDDVAATLNEDAAKILNAIFGVTAFQKGLPIGTADVRALLDRRH
jgi:hypothetical protein